VQNYRELQVGAVLLWIALPQFVIVFRWLHCFDALADGRFSLLAPAVIAIVV